MLQPTKELAVLLWALLACANSFGPESTLRCLDNDGEPVDWWFMYKTPDGYKFAYNDPSSGDTTSPLVMFEREMDDTTNPVAITRTLQAIAEHQPTRTAAYAANSLAASMAANASAPSYYLYNDQPDVGTASSVFGHTKGVVAAAGDHKSGLWIVHSTPHWPSSTGAAKFYFPEQEIKFGQTFLCLSLDQHQLDDVGIQQQLTRPYIYMQTNFFNEANSAVAALYPNIAKVLAGQWNTVPGTHAIELNAGSDNLHRFTSLAKNKEWDDDIYENLVAKYYKSGFLVESWMRGQQLGPYCPPKYGYRVVDAKTLYVIENGNNVTWTETQDHAKWAVSLDKSYVLCVGDMNRMLSQRVRGGGAVCFSNKKLCYGMYNTVATSSTCPSHGRSLKAPHAAFTPLSLANLSRPPLSPSNANLTRTTPDR